MKDSLVLGYPNALGGNNCNLSFGIAKKSEELNYDEIMNMFKKYSLQARSLMLDKNHDYGEAWKDMRVSSLTDLILQKLLRVKQIEDNKGKTLVSEGIDANYQDMINYAVFALIHLGSESEK